MSPQEDEIYTITFEQVEKTAREFGHVAIRVPAYGQVIVFDDTIMGAGFIKQFDDTPLSYMLARRFAVRLCGEDENRDFNELIAEVEGEHK